MKHFLKIEDCSADLLAELIEKGMFWKSMNENGLNSTILDNKVVGMIFEKPSTRTRVAFEVGTAKLGGKTTFMNKNDLQLSRNESIKDTAQVLSSYLDGIVIRTYKHEVLEEFAKYSDIPIINALCEKEHPCQAIADLMTIKAEVGNLKGTKIVFAGRYNNVSHSLMLGSLKMGMTFSLFVPKFDVPNDTITKSIEQVAEQNGGKLIITQDVKEAMEDSRFVYTDVWQSMGDEADLDSKNLMGYQLNKNLLQYAEDAKVMHCLPAKLREEITEDVFEEHAKTIFEQAENKLYAQMAVLEKFIK